MDRYECPTCKSTFLAWDARSQAFLCVSESCAASFKPSVQGMRAQEAGILISRGQLSIDPEWFARQMTPEGETARR